MENTTSLGRSGEEQRDNDNTRGVMSGAGEGGAGEEALQLVKSEERTGGTGGGQEGASGGDGAGVGVGGGGEPHSVITSRRAMRTITTAGHIADAADLPPDDSVKDEPSETSLDSEHMQYAAKMEESAETRAAHHAYDEERLRLAEAETARYLAFKQEPYRALQAGASAVPADKRPGAQFARPPPRPAYGRGLALRYGAPHHIIVAQDGEPEDHSHEAFAMHKDKSEQMQAYVASSEASAAEARQYAAALGEQTAPGALEMIQTTSLSNQQAVGVAYQQVKYETRGEPEPRPSTYASLQPVTSVHGGYAYAGQSPQYAASGTYGAYGGGKELLTLYGGAGGAGAAAGAPGGRGDESPPGQLLYRADPTLSSSSLPRGAHVVYGSVVPQSQAVYEAPPSPNSQQVSTFVF